MDYSRFVALRAPLWQSLEEGLSTLRDDRTAIDHRRLTELAVGYRQVLHDHALAAARFPGTHASRRLQRLASEGARLLVHEAGERSPSLSHYLRHTFPLAARRMRPFLGVALIVFAVSALLGWVLSSSEPALGLAFLGPAAVEKLERGELWTEQLTTSVPPSASSSAIATNNLGVALLAFAGGVVGGVVSLYVLVINGLLLGALFAFTARYGMSGELAEFVTAHGPLELTIIVFSAGAGLSLGWALVAAADRPRREVLSETGRHALFFLAGCLPWLLVLGVVEATISPAPEVPPWAKLAIGLALEAVFLSLAFAPVASSSSEIGDGP